MCNNSRKCRKDSFPQLLIFELRRKAGVFFSFPFFHCAFLKTWRQILFVQPTNISSDGDLIFLAILVILV